ncbi:MAG: PIF1-like helicase, partial [Dehalococcoidia bacterium]|nr:PIF1-like helicase [Dehalococcoidia bacterium]
MSDSSITIDTPLEGLQYKLLVQRLMLQAPGMVRLIAGQVSLEGVTLNRGDFAKALARETNAATLTSLDQYGGEPRGLLLSGPTWTMELHFDAADDFDYVYDTVDGASDDDVSMPKGLLSLACIGDSAPLSEALTRLGVRSSLTHKTDQTVSVTFAFQGPRGPTYREGIFDKLPLSVVRANYAPTVVAQVEHLITLMRDKTHGLVFLGGPTGTGKSYLIRTILSELRTSRKGLVCSPALDFLRNPGLLLQVASQYKRAIVVL